MGQNKDLTEIGILLFNVIEDTIKEFPRLQTKEERNEVRVVLFHEIERILYNKLPKNVALEIRAGLLSNLLKNFSLDLLTKRVAIYLRCPYFASENNPLLATPKTRVFALSHFLQAAHGKTSGRDMTAVIIGKEPLTSEDMGEFLDPFEGMDLILGITKSLILVAKSLDAIKIRFANLAQRDEGGCAGCFVLIVVLGILFSLAGLLLSFR